jgi:hypothetical protein
VKTINSVGSLHDACLDEECCPLGLLCVFTARGGRDDDKRAEQ